MSTTRDQYVAIRDAAKSGPVHPTGIASALEINTRYARELVGVLHYQGFLDENEEGEFEISLAQTEEEFAEFLDNNTPSEESQVPTATTSTPKSTKPKPVSKSGSVTDCLCRCGDKVAGKANYKPGHDARHAGQVAREIASNYSTKGFDRKKILATLPSDKLKVKAEAIADRLVSKIETKAAGK